jgi:hypothetical protein
VKCSFFKLTIYLILSSIFSIIPSKVLAADVVINEFQVAPSNAQWVELYNKSDQAVDISGWIIDDDGGTQKYTINNGIILYSHKCISFQSGNFNFNTASSDSAKLIKNNEVIDSYSYSGSPGENVSFGRSSDGSDTWTTFSSPSRDKINSTNELCLVPTTTPSPTVTSIPSVQPDNTSTPNPTPIQSTSVAKPKPTATKYPKYSPTPELTVTAEPLSPTESIAEVLGESVSKTTAGKRFSPILLVILLGAGIGCIGAAVVLSYKQLRRKRRGF